MTFLSRLTFGILLAGTVTLGCSSTNDNPTGTGGTGGGGGGGGGSAFIAVSPCSAASSYTTTGTTIAFGGTDPGFNYAPMCLKVSTGASVTFNGDFSMHPLGPSALRGTTTGNPIVVTNTGTTASFTFPTAGFWAYYCMFHGSDADGQFMSGVIWVN